MRYAYPTVEILNVRPILWKILSNIHFCQNLNLKYLQLSLNARDNYSQWRIYGQPNIELFRTPQKPPILGCPYIPAPCIHSWLYIKTTQAIKN